MFMACMLLHPEAQQKAQEEIDRVVGRDRLPEFSDRDSLPFVTAVVYESFRLVISVLAMIYHSLSQIHALFFS